MLHTVLTMDSLYPMDEENLQQLECWEKGDGDLCSLDDTVGQNPFDWIETGKRLFCNGIGYVRILADAVQQNGEWKVKVLPVLRNGQESSIPIYVKADKITNLISPLGEEVRPRSRIPTKRFCEEQPARTQNGHVKKMIKKIQTDPMKRLYDAYHVMDDEESNKSSCSSSDEDFESFSCSSDDNTECSVDTDSNSLVTLSENFDSCVDQPVVSAINSPDFDNNSIASERTWDTQ